MHPLLLAFLCMCVCLFFLFFLFRIIGDGCRLSTAIFMHASRVGEPFLAAKAWIMRIFLGLGKRDMCRWSEKEKRVVRERERKWEREREREDEGQMCIRDRHFSASIPYTKGGPPTGLVSQQDYLISRGFYYTLHSTLYNLSSANQKCNSDSPSSTI